MVNGADAEVNEMNKTVNNRTASFSNLFSFLLSIDVSLLSWKDVKQETRLLLKRRGIAGPRSFAVLCKPAASV